MKTSLFYKGIVLIVVIVPLLATVYAIWQLWARYVNATDVALLIGMYSITALGVTVGFHRMLTHRSFQPHLVVKTIFLVLGSMSAEGPAIEWAASHIKHHALADRQGDPHSPLDGFFHAHLGWLFNGLADPNVYCRHLVKDRLERAGMHWTVPGAQALLDVRSIYVSGLWDEYQADRIERETERLYPYRHLVPPQPIHDMVA